MTNEEMVREVILEHLGVGNVSLSDKFKEDLRADSLDLVEMLIQVETLTGQEIDEKDLDSIKTVGDFVALLGRYL